MNGSNGGKWRQNGSKQPPSSTVTRPPPTSATEAWLNAIQDATECVTPNSSSRNSPNNAEQVAASLNYLNMLASILEEHSYCDWDDADAPTSSPPAFYHQQSNAGAPDLAYYANNGYYHPQLESPPAMIAVPSSATSSSWSADASSSANRFAMFQNDEESSSDEDEQEDDTTQDEAGDIFPSSTSASNTLSHLSMRRIMIRVLTAQSEVYACQASQSQWQHGADLYQVSLLKIHQALEFADSECAKWLSQGKAFPVTLKQDADIVAVAIEYLASQKTKFINKALAKEQYLLKKLQPQWHNRDCIKQKWGTERWTNNPNPKRNFAEIRARDEEQLRQVQAALESLDKVDTSHALASSQQLQQQVTSSNNKKQHENRNNGKRPSANLLQRRVSPSDYPDACEFGWTFTGSHGKVEYFENDDGVKLDWYFTTASVKTMMNGQPILFGTSVVTPNDYLDILLNPRGHSNAHNNNNNNNNNHKAHPNERKPSRSLWMPHD